MKILLIGGSKSGKSHLAQELTRALANGAPMYYWATMEPSDGEDLARIEKHIMDRAGWGFKTIERGRELVSAPLPENAGGASALFDSVTALVTNEMFGPDFDIKNAEALANAARKRSEEGLLALSRAFCNFICVADDVFRDGMDFDETTELWRKALAGTLRTLSAEFDTVCEVAVGIPKPIKGPLPEGF